MSTPQIHLEFFHQAMQVETLIQLWAQDQHYQDRGLDEMFYYQTPVMKTEIPVSYSQFMAKVNDLAQRYGTAVRMPQDALKDIHLSGKAIYGLSLHVLDRARVQSSDLRDLSTLKPLVNDFVALIEAYVSFDHPQPRARIKFNDSYAMTAKIAFRSRNGDLDQFNDGKCLAMAKRADKKISEMFSDVPGTSKT